MKDRKVEIENYFRTKKYSYEIKFAISPINITNRTIESNKFIKEFLKLLDKYNISFSIENRQCTTYIRPFNLYRNWIVTDLIECIEVKEGVYPLNWNIEDLLLLDKLANKSDLIFNIYHYGSRKCINR